MCGDAGDPGLLAAIVPRMSSSPIAFFATWNPDAKMSAVTSALVKPGEYLRDRHRLDCGQVALEDPGARLQIGLGIHEGEYFILAVAAGIIGVSNPSTTADPIADRYASVFAVGQASDSRELAGSDAPRVETDAVHRHANSGVW